MRIKFYSTRHSWPTHKHTQTQTQTHTHTAKSKKYHLTNRVPKLPSATIIASMMHWNTLVATSPAWRNWSSELPKPIWSGDSPNGCAAWKKDFFFANLINVFSVTTKINNHLHARNWNINWRRTLARAPRVALSPAEQARLTTPLEKFDKFVVQLWHIGEHFPN